jgi:hypothetical protein
MYGGTIRSNTSNGSNSFSGGGGGVYIASGGHFTKTPLYSGASSGIIYGSDVDGSLANTSYNSTHGNAVWYYVNEKRRNTTLYGFDTISTENVGLNWD